MTLARQWYMDVLDGHGVAMQEIPFSGRRRIGRAAPDTDVDIAIPPECRSASRLHAVIESREGQVLLTDQSRFGTIVNGTVVLHSSLVLRHGDDVIFGLPHDGWRVRLRITGGPEDATAPSDPLESLVVFGTPRQVQIGRLVIEEHLGGPAFRLLEFLAHHKGQWYRVDDLVDLVYPDPARTPYQARQALSRYKKAINDLLRPHVRGQDAIEVWPHRGYRLRSRLDAR